MDSSAPPLSKLQRHGLPELPSDWQWVRFSDICERVSVGHVGPTAEYFRDRADGIRFLRSQNVRPGRLDLETATAIAPEFHQKLKKSKLRGGDILFVRVGANRGDCCVVPEGLGELNCANIVFARPKHRTGFHAYFFQSDLGQSLLLSASVGAAQGVINTSSVASMPVPLPPLPVQQRIAGILAAYDELMENSQRRIRLLEAMARALYREWFVHFRFPGHEKLPRVASPLGDIPQGWEVKRLCDMFEFIGGSQPPKSEHAYDEQPGYVRFIQNRDYGSSRHLTYIKENRKNKLCDRLDIMVDKYGEPGKTRFGLAGAYNVALAKLLPHKPHHREWLRGLISEPDFNTYLVGASMAATRASLNSSHFTVDVAVPSDEVSQAFQRHVEPLLKLSLAHQDQIQNLRRTRDLLLPRLLSGQVALAERGDV